jgi:hypothetical protein
MAAPIGWNLYNFMQGKNAPPGQIAWSEFGQMTQSVGWDYNTAQAMFQQTDTDRTGFIDQNEWLAFAARPDVAPYIQRIEAGMAAQPQPQMGAGPPQQVMAELDLNATSGLILKQKIEWLEALATTAGFGCCEQANNYGIYDSTGRPVYMATEESNCLYRCCCKPYHEAKIKIHTTADGKTPGAIKFTVHKPCKCGGCCPAVLPFCRMEATVREGEEEEGKFVGKIDQPCCGGGFSPKLNLQDEAGTTTATVEGPTLCIGSCCDVTFNAFRVKDGTNEASIGQIKKEGVNKGGETGMGGVANMAKGLGKELFTDADNFVLNYNAELEVNEKVTLMSTLLLLDFMFFEGDGNCQRKTGGGCSVKLCDIYCCGCICPCKLESGGNE